MYKTILTLTFLAVASQAAAKEATYVCSVSGKSSGYIQEEILIGYDEQAQTVRVLDGLIHHYEGAAIAGKVSENSAKKQTFTWTLATRSRNGQNTRMAYRAVMFKKTGKAIVYAKPHGYSNNFISRGSCKISNKHRIPAS